MATNDFGFSSAMAKFDSAYNQKANRQYTQAQTKKLERDNLREDYQNLNNEVLAQNTFSVKDGGLVANVDKILNLSPQLFETFINEGNRLSEYKDAKGNTVKGRLLKPDVFTTTLPDGKKVKRYGLRIQDMDGNIKPVTQMRSTEEGDNPLLLDAKGLATVFEAQGMNLLAKGGLSGAASGLLQGLNLEESMRAKLQEAGGQLISDPNAELGPGDMLSGLTDINEQLGGLRKDDEIVDASGGTDVKDLKGGQAGPGPIAPITNTLTMKESSNNPNALWQNAETDTFKDQPPVTEQTLAQILDFTKIDGDYANWSKQQPNKATGKTGDVHTPVGKYQFVGKTLRDIKDRGGFEELGFDDTTVFTEQNQDKLFEWYMNDTIKAAGPNATQEQIRAKIRGRWEGISTTDQMSDEELDGIISQVQAGTYASGGDSTPAASGGFYVSPLGVSTADDPHAKLPMGRNLLTFLPSDQTGLSGTTKAGDRNFVGGGTDKIPGWSKEQIDSYVTKEGEFPFRISKEQFLSLNENQQKKVTRDAKNLSEQNIRRGTEQVLLKDGMRAYKHPLRLKSKGEGPQFFPSFAFNANELGQEFAKYLDPNQNAGLDAEGLATKKAIIDLYGDPGPWNSSGKVQKIQAKALAEKFAANPEKFEEFGEDPIAFARNNPNFLSGKTGPKIDPLGIASITGESIKGAESIPSDIPTTLKGAREWFSDEKNVDFLRNLDPKATEAVQSLLEEKQINSKADLIKAVQNNIINDVQFKQAALLIAYSYNGGTNVTDSLNLYQSMVNDMQTGNPGTTTDDVRKTDISARDLAHRINKFHTEQANTFTTELKELNDAAVVPGFTTGSKKLDYSTDNAVFISKLKPAMTTFLRVIRSGGAGMDPAVYREQLELMDGVMAKSIDDEIGDSSEGLVDWIGDLFLRGQRTETLGGDFANFHIVYDQTKKNKNGDPLPIRIQFTNTRGKYQLPADESMSWEDFTAKVGNPEVANYIEARVRGS
jgi:hypothetical protein